MLPLYLSKQMEIWVEVLTIILVGMGSHFVVMGALVLPLLKWLHIEEFHERIEFNLVEFAAKLLVM